MVKGGEEGEGTMRKKITRAGLAGWLMAKAIIAMVNLFYQNKTAYNFIVTIAETLQAERDRRFFKIRD